MALRILLAEDCPSVRQSVTELLRSAGVLSIVTTADGADAVSLARETAPDVVILDYGLPRMNGVAAAQLIHQHAPGTPIILLTASVADYLIAAALRAGVRGYVLKSDAGDDLIRAMDTVLSGVAYISPGASRVLYQRFLPPSGAA
jgi:DNA-binding NarL/FixJ family response regulator